MSMFITLWKTRLVSLGPLKHLFLIAAGQWMEKVLSVAGLIKFAQCKHALVFNPKPKRFDVESQSVVSLGNHDSPISCCTSNGKGISIPKFIIDTVVTGSWDKSVKVWDLRDNKEQTLLSQPDKVFSADIDGYYMVVALAGRIIQIYDLRNTNEMLDSRESSLKYMLRKVGSITDDFLT
jgi:WD40 repeat protein